MERDRRGAEVSKYMTLEFGESRTRERELQRWWVLVFLFILH